jgi:glycosyltransferase involved in cell wall biosynthesis
MSDIDVSVVLNLHREAMFLAPTLRSLQACAQRAKESGIVVELVAVFDRSDDATRKVFRSITMPAFCRVQEVEVDVGSLGLARNVGIDHAQGEFIWTSDADDLVSSNCIVALLDTARRHARPEIAVFVEYLCAFGDQYHTCRYVSSEHLVAADYALQHPYVSRIFVRRAAFDSIRYDDLRVTSGFAYEDWFMNCELRAMGYDMAVAPDTVFFYRQRAGSLLRQANATSVKLIPHSRLFDVETFLADMQACRDRVGSWGQFMKKRSDIFERNNTHSFMKSEKLVGFLRDAMHLEPEIEPGRVEMADSYSPIPWNPRHWGMQLENFYRMVGKEKFTDVVLLPWLKPGGAEKFILQVLEEIAAKEPRSRFLVVTGESARVHEWAEKLPRHAVFIDAHNAFPLLDDSECRQMLLRAMLAISEDGARLHLKSSVFAHRMLDAYAPVLAAKFRTIYYRFSDGTYVWRGEQLRGPWGINHMRRHLGGFWKVVCDCNAIADYDRAFLGLLDSKYETVYARCDPRSTGSSASLPKRRLLWASRVAPEKRPELLARIAAALKGAGMDVTIDAYGAACDGLDPRDLFDRQSSIVYRGSFSSFSDLPIESYDAFLYTSAYDGLPNVLLEALASGLPVIAPDVGGIKEAVVSGVTGWLIPMDDDDTLVRHYVDAVRELYADWPATAVMASNGRDLISRRHAAEAFTLRVAEALDLDPGLDRDETKVA